MSLKAIRTYFLNYHCCCYSCCYYFYSSKLFLIAYTTDNNNNVSAGQCFKNERNTKPWHIFYSCYSTRGISVLNIPTSTWKEWACVCMLAVSQLKTKISDKLCFSLLELELKVIHIEIYIIFPTDTTNVAHFILFKSTLIAWVDGERSHRDKSQHPVKKMFKRQYKSHSKIKSSAGSEVHQTDPNFKLQ